MKDTNTRSLAPSSGTSRREFLKTIGTAAFAMPFIAHDLRAAPPSSRIRHASFGAAGMAWADLTAIASVPNVEVVAVCDVDTARMADARKRFPKARFYQDWRRLLDAEAKNIDSVNVSTPDHSHAPIAVSSMLLGKHVYGQKPLAHNLYETRRMKEVARERNVVTQMGIQIHAGAYYRSAVAFLRSGGIGKIKEVHSWCAKHWGDKGKLPTRTDRVPPNLLWDVWLGGCADRPYIGGGYYHPGNWRKRLDFGTGTLGDMACHILDPVFGALDLGSPTSVRSEGPKPNEVNWATNAKVILTFDGTPRTAGKSLTLFWYDGSVFPPRKIADLVTEWSAPPGDPNRKRLRGLPSGGSIFVGTDGVMLLEHISQARLYPREKFADIKLPRERSGNHWAEFVEACRGNGKTQTGFDYSGPLTEAVLLGGVASRFPKTTLLWDSANSRFDIAEANAFTRREYRSGWAVPGL
ncbi:MAG: Gfo/Idh/MocA family oxidoreductase [Puniceicoccales bacterium]|jgi:predicted dehydrogenase|nr:Gfo/Idh/MocA family oxidoreductase [Puniceicoccales bacterium]